MRRMKPLTYILLLVVFGLAVVSAAAAVVAQVDSQPHVVHPDTWFVSITALIGACGLCLWFAFWVGQKVAKVDVICHQQRTNTDNIEKLVKTVNQIATVCRLRHQEHGDPIPPLDGG